jgi:hypothetical protein
MKKGFAKTTIKPTTMNANNIPLIVFIAMSFGWAISDYVMVSRIIRQREQLEAVAGLYRTADSLLHAQNPRTIEADLRSRLRGVRDSAKIMRQAIAESGNFNSNRFRKHNALFGEQHHRPVEYCHPMESFGYYMRVLYKDRGKYKTFAKFLDAHKFEHDYE